MYNKDYYEKHREIYKEANKKYTTGKKLAEKALCFRCIAEVESKELPVDVKAYLMNLLEKRYSKVCYSLVF